MPQTSEHTQAVKAERKLPTLEEVDERLLQLFPAQSAMCPLLCREYQILADELETVSNPKLQAPILVKLRALGFQMRAFQCPRCPVF